MKTALEAVLQAMVSGAWANESDGNVEAPTGHFARVTNDRDDMSEIWQAFHEVMSTYGMDDSSVLIGYFLVVEDSQGNVHIEEFPNEILLTRAFQHLQDEYAHWNKD